MLILSFLLLSIGLFVTPSARAFEGRNGENVVVGLVAGYAIELAGDLGDDLVAAGFSLANGGGSGLGGDLVFAGYQALLAGRIEGTADVAGGAVDVEGTVGGKLNVDVGGAGSGQGGRMPPGFPFVPGVPRYLRCGPG